MIQTLFLVFDQDKRVSYMGELVGVLIVLLNNMHIMEFPKQIHTDTHTQTHTHTHTQDILPIALIKVIIYLRKY